jgi:hypothetical protein
MHTVYIPTRILRTPLHAYCVHPYMHTAYTPTCILCTPLHAYCVHPYMHTVYTPTCILRTPLHAYCVHPYMHTAYTPACILCTPLNTVMFRAFRVPSVCCGHRHQSGRLGRLVTAGRVGQILGYLVGSRRADGHRNESELVGSSWLFRRVGDVVSSTVDAGCKVGYVMGCLVG